MDAEVAAFVARTEQAYGAAPPVWSAAAGRAAYDRMCRAFDRPHAAGLAVSDGAFVPENPDRSLAWRGYVPSGVAPGAKVLFFHGGGFVLGGLASHDSVCADLAQAAGVALVALDYRLAPEHPYPAALDDAEAAFDALVAGGDRLIVAGDSAGGTLAAAVCLRLRGRGKALPAAQVLIYPMLHPDAGRARGTWRAEAPMLTAADCVRYRRLYTGRNDQDMTDDPELAPLAAADFSGLPPTALFAADIDPLAEDSADYAAALQRAGVPAALHGGEGLVHGYLRGRHESARMGAAFAEIAATIRRFASSALTQNEPLRALR